MPYLANQRAYAATRQDFFDGDIQYDDCAIHELSLGH